MTLECFGFWSRARQRPATLAMARLAPPSGVALVPGRQRSAMATRLALSRITAVSSASRRAWRPMRRPLETTRWAVATDQPTPVDWRGPPSDRRPLVRSRSSNWRFRRGTRSRSTCRCWTCPSHLGPNHGFGYDQAGEGRTSSGDNDPGAVRTAVAGDTAVREPVTSHRSWTGRPPHGDRPVGPRVGSRSHDAGTLRV